MGKVTCLILVYMEVVLRPISASSSLGHEVEIHTVFGGRKRILGSGPTELRREVQLVTENYFSSVSWW